MTTTGKHPEAPRPRRTHLSRLRTAAAGSVLAAVSITGVGAAAAPASAAELRSFLAPLDRPGEAAGSPGSDTPGSDTPGSDTDRRTSDEGRLLGIRQDLANAVAWGSVTQQQADQFYTQMQSRIARGL
ncbi:hypothetical protein QNO08_14270 [Arthrobacter sp. zg-Y820]|uniref:hypothetical protein n=1 Tax=unclassified Arthrobacter TaxID=235627 RepID=UPI001E4917E4|nr:MULTISPECIES: hypothetical protein [unclassified Arthrobacter]MCC9195727.1 hypothetical protein [Arthrobacter sp. zg-Y820]MDK1278586.1 hypothetical protein [Arthrobacter sp. zg.Y820]WIB08981.1 hypothetical protein QNO08_14270 [Arthrobacter sp. zg-Y820]